MFKNYFIIAIRNIVRHKFYSVINILGLAIGIACFVMIGMWVQDELGYDKHFKNAQRIYRIEDALITSGESTALAGADPRLTEHIRAQYPEVGTMVRVINFPTLLTYNNKAFYETNAFYADSTFFDVFSFNFIKGDGHTALSTKGAVVIAESVAHKIFGNDNPIGKVIYITNDRNRTEKDARTVTGVIKDNNHRSHFHPTVIFSKFHGMESFEETYALFKEGYTPKQFEEHVWNPLYNSFFKEEYAGDKQAMSLHITPLTQIHLSGNIWGDIEPNGTMTTVYIFSVIGFFILLIAAINYINLATARSYGRAREVGVRKVLGATKEQLVTQFLVEAVVITLAAAILSFSFIEMALPFFNKLSGKTLELQLLSGGTIGFMVAVVLVVGVGSGIYPAFFISSFLPIKALKGTIDASGSRLPLRKILVVIQFSLSVIMLIATMVIARQLAYVKNTDLGFNKDQVLVVNLDDPAISKKLESIKDDLLKNPNIIKAAGSYNIPGSELNHTYLKFEMPTGMEARLISSMFVDYDFINVMGLKLIEGTGYDKGMTAQVDTGIFVVMNESAKQMLGWQTAVNKRVESGTAYGFRRGRVVGVVKDFHAASLHEHIPPMVFTLARRKYNYLSVKMKPANVAQTIRYVEKVYKSYGQGYPFEYSFLDESFNRQYDKEEKQQVLFNWFAGLCIFISCLGAMGLASFSTRQRTKEIGIRKISGATVLDIVLLLSKDLVKLLLVAFAIAVPIAYYAMQQWLQNFAYHTGISIFILLAAGIVTALIALITISIHTIRAANKDPATIMKYE